MSETPEQTEIEDPELLDGVADPGWYEVWVSQREPGAKELMESRGLKWAGAWFVLCFHDEHYFPKEVGDYQTRAKAEAAARCHRLAHRRADAAARAEAEERERRLLETGKCPTCGQPRDRFR